MHYSQVFGLVWCASAATICYVYGNLIGLVICLSVCLGIYNFWCHRFLLAGPRTSRQVPPQVMSPIILLSATQLHEAYIEGSLRCIDVARAYITHIQSVNPYINAIVFECFDEAIQQAKIADAKWKRWREEGRYHGEDEPSLVLGVPCTIKENMMCKGCPNSSGTPYREKIISTRDSFVVHNFREAGAVILGVTNTSEVCMWFESSNYIYGITCNPYDNRCLVGGSSGGEGAAAGSAMACFGLGSDIGGSIRMPCFFNGVYGLKTTPHMISNEGQYPGAKTSANHFLATGPITRFIEDLLPLARIAAQGGFRMDPIDYPPAPSLSPTSVLPQMPWWDHEEWKNDETYFGPPSPRFVRRKITTTVAATPHLPTASSKPFRIYMLEDYGGLFVPVSDSQKEAVRAAGEALQRAVAGSELFNVNVREPQRCTGGVVPEPFGMFSRSLSMWIHALSTDPSETTFTDVMGAGAPGKVYWMAELLRWSMGRSRHTLPALALCVIEDLERHLPSFITLGRKGSQALECFQKSIAEFLKRENAIIVAPTFPSPAPRHHFPLWSPMQFQYTAVFNVLQLPAIACPVWLGYEMKERLCAMSPEMCREAGLPADHHLPKGVQLVGNQGMDETLLGLALLLKKELQGGYRYPSWAHFEENF